MTATAPDTAAFAGLPDLARADLGGRALLCSDEFFAGMDNLLDPGEPVWDADRYTDRGKWMDGWEPRRRRSPGQDWVIVELGVRSGWSSRAFAAAAKLVGAKMVGVDLSEGCKDVYGALLSSDKEVTSRVKLFWKTQRMAANFT